MTTTPVVIIYPVNSKCHIGHDNNPHKKTNLCFLFVSFIFFFFTWELTEVYQTGWLYDQSLDTSMLAWRQKFQKACVVSVNVSSPALQGFDVLLKVWCEMLQQPLLIGTSTGCYQYGAHGPFSWSESFCLILLCYSHSPFPKTTITKKLGPDKHLQDCMYKNIVD